VLDLVLLQPLIEDLVAALLEEEAREFYRLGLSIQSVSKTQIVISRHVARHKRPSEPRVARETARGKEDSMSQ
jgi:hypothetical protein